GLFSTPWDPVRPGTILFIEDVSEPIYKIERMLYTLRLNGTLGSLAGLIVGRFTNYTPDRDNDSMEAMISRLVADYEYPVAFGVPIGHVDHNVPMLCGAEATLDVSASGVTLS
ncbi:MAG: LD-carboxypeptidase, partial [Duncaniella sp.]|nr:LD-carboxypeptidase [Duncaniella sp.]